MHEFTQGIVALVETTVSSHLAGLLQFRTPAGCCLGPTRHLSLIPCRRRRVAGNELPASRRWPIRAVIGNARYGLSRVGTMPGDLSSRIDNFGMHFALRGQRGGSLKNLRGAACRANDVESIRVH